MPPQPGHGYGQRLGVIRMSLALVALPNTLGSRYCRYCYCPHLEMSKLRTWERREGSTHLCSSSEWTTTQCGTHSWAWGARPLSPHGPWGLLWLAAPYRHLARGRARQVSACPGAHPLRAKQAEWGKVTSRSWKGGSCSSEVAGGNRICVCVKPPVSPSPTTSLLVKLALPFPPETVTDTYTC